ncbi:helix-turn-helix domain-containing protein [Nocardia sp. NPDC050697]|uniref:PucR family transcriptional regulator n=1 Tax=Nocardia sp. NPDC050697 TaxID=3155158 RepID=UPI0034026996
MVAVDSAIVHAWLADFAERVRTEGETAHVLRYVDRAMLEEFPRFAADPELRGEVRTSGKAHWLGLLAGIGQPRFRIRPPIEVIDGARTVARRGYDLNVLLKTYRVGQRGLWRYITGVLDLQIRDPELRGAVLVTFWERSSQWLDGCLDAVVTAYLEEREQRSRSAEEQRAATVRALLRGDAAAAELTPERLGHNVEHQQIALTLWAEHSMASPVAARVLARLAADTAAALGGPPPLTLPSGTHGLWAWVATPEPADVALIPAPPVPGTRMAAGTPWPGVRGFRRSHREALAAQRLATDGAAAGPVIAYRDVELVCLLTGDGSVESARLLVERELGGIAGPGEPAARLRETVREFLAGGGSVTATAEALGVHSNTVRYRLQQAEQRLGRPIEQRRLHLELALEVLAAYGDELLPTG